MSEQKGTTLVIAIFLAIFTLIHAYVIGRLFVWTHTPLDATYIWTVAGLVLLFPIATALEQRFLNWGTRILYTIATVWMGTLTILVLAVLTGELLTLFLDSQIVAASALAITVLAVTYALFIGKRFVVREHTITGPVKKPLRIVLASDVHAGAVHGKRYLQLIVDAINARGADLALFPGDLVDGPGRLPDDLLEPLDSLSMPHYHSFGNHEFYVGEQEVNRVLTGRKIVSLRNTFTDLNAVRVIGIDDAEDRKQIEKTLSGLAKKNAYNILLYHRPDGLEEAAKQGVDLMVSGHTHNGQIFPFTLLVKLRFPRKKGWYAYKNTKLFVSTGAGTWGPPMRLGSRSEVVFITVLPQKNKEKK